MRVARNPYRKLNPFLNISVGENEIWADEEATFSDVPSIHGDVFDQLLDEFEQVDADHISRVRFLVGEAGTGKSHLFARLRRNLGHGQFTFVSNPPADHREIKRHILKRVISGMRRPARTESGRLPYSQLTRIVYLLLQRVRRYPGLPPHRIHEAWKQVRRKTYYPTEEDLFIEGLERSPQIEIPLSIRRVLFRVLDDERRSIATDWLSGSESLRDEDYERLGVSGPLENHHIPDLMKRLGALSIGAGPIVLVLDQLDGLTGQEQIREIESLLIDLRDASHNWYVIIGLLRPRFQFWESALSAPFRGRFGRPGSGRPLLEASEISGPTPEQARELLELRLASPELQNQRALEQTDNPYAPLSDETLEKLTNPPILSARVLLQRASEAYVESVTGAGQEARPLAEFLEETFQDIRGQLNEADLAVDTATLADRINDLFYLIEEVERRGALDSSYGPLHTSMKKFRGSDRIYRCNGREIRVVGYDIQHASNFPNVLKKIVDAPKETILVRDGRIRATGKLTGKLLQQFRRDKAFIHMPFEEIKTLHTLGAVLAKMREGDFQHERTEPRPSEENILRWLAGHQTLMETDVARKFVELVESDEVAPPAPPPLDPDPPSTEMAREPVVQMVERIMEVERWLSFERLCALVSDGGVTVSPDEVSACFASDTLSGNVTVYPLNSNPLEAPGIVIWTAEV